MHSLSHEQSVDRIATINCSENVPGCFSELKKYRTKASNANEKRHSGEAYVLYFVSLERCKTHTEIETSDGGTMQLKH